MKSNYEITELTAKNITPNDTIISVINRLIKNNLKTYDEILFSHPTEDVYRKGYYDTRIQVFADARFQMGYLRQQLGLQPIRLYANCTTEFRILKWNGYSC